MGIVINWRHDGNHGCRFCDWCDLWCWCMESLVGDCQDFVTPQWALDCLPCSTRCIAGGKTDGRRTKTIPWSVGILSSWHGNLAWFLLAIHTATHWFALFQDPARGDAAGWGRHFHFPTHHLITMTISRSSWHSHSLMNGVTVWVKVPTMWCEFTSESLTKYYRLL